MRPDSGRRRQTNSRARHWRGDELVEVLDIDAMEQAAAELYQNVVIHISEENLEIGIELPQTRH